MNEKFLSRGKRKDNGEWIEGTLIFTTAVEEKPYIVDSCWCPYGKINEEGYADFDWLNAYEVIPETLGGCIGLTDKNGKMIFEGDIVTVPKEDELYKIIWDEDTARFTISGFNVICDFDNYWGHELEVVGNIYDNPKLIGVDRNA